MHDIEPYFGWRKFYIASEDPKSPFYEQEYSEFMYTHSIYNYYIHPQWDCIDSNTLYVKLLYCNYDLEFAVIELIGEWNDVLHNDIMYLYRNLIEHLIGEGITKYLIIGENVLNFHPEDDDYYQEWFDNIGETGWILALNFQQHVKAEFESANLDYYICFSESFESVPWRTIDPLKLYNQLNQFMTYRLK